MTFCTECGASLADDVAYCVNCGQKVERSPSSGPIAATVAVSPTAREVSATSKQLTSKQTTRGPLCEGCGATIQFEIGATEAKCDYCGSITQKPEPIPPLEVERATPSANTPLAPAQSIVPLKVDINALKRAMHGHMASGDYTPVDLVETAQIILTELMYVPVFNYDLQIEGSWSASFGYDRKETYVEIKDEYVNGVHRKVPTNATRTVTDWRPATGTISHHTTGSAYAGKLLTFPKSPEVAQKVATSDFLTTYSDSYAKQAKIAEPFSADPNSAYTQRVKPTVDKLTEALAKKNAQGDHQKDWHWYAKVEKTTSKVFVPIAHATFQYEGKRYEYWADGVNLNHVAADTLPVDSSQQSAAWWGFVPLVLALVGMPLMGALVAKNAMDGVSWIGAIAIAITAIYGIARRASIISYSKRRREQALERVRSGGGAGQSGDSSPMQRPWLANASRDMFVLPILSIAALMMIAGPIRTSRDFGSQANSSERQTGADTGGSQKSYVSDNYSPSSTQNMDVAGLSIDEAIKSGNAAYERSDFAQAHKYWLIAAEKGNAIAQNAIGAMYENGKGVQKDSAKSIEWFEKAAAQGNASAQSSLGVAYNIGQGVPQNYAKSMEWFQKAAAVETDGYSAAWIAMMYEAGEGVKKDDTLAIEWFKKSVAQGNEDSKRWVAMLEARQR